MVREELSDLLQREMKDPRIGLATITEVEMTPDLRLARIFVSVLGSAEERKATLQALRHASGFVRRELGKRVRLRHVPELVFVPDASLERGARVLELLKTIDTETPVEIDMQDDDTRHD